MKKTVIIGASHNPSRYSFMAAQMLQQYGHPFVPVSNRSGDVLGQTILDIQTQPAIPDVDTVTLYLGPQHQPAWYDYILSLKPKRIIFNPGTENDEFERLAHQHGIEPIEACTLVMLRTGQY